MMGARPHPQSRRLSQKYGSSKASYSCLSSSYSCLLALDLLCRPTARAYVHWQLRSVSATWKQGSRVSG